MIRTHLVALLVVTFGVMTSAQAQLPPSADEAWAALAYDGAAFTEIVSISRDVHLTGVIPAAAWIKAANGALRVLRPRLRLAVRTSLGRGDKISQPGRPSRISRLSCLDKRLALVEIRPRSPADTTAARRRLRAARRQARQQERQRLATIPFGRAGLNCVMAAVARRLPVSTGLPADATPTVVLQRRAWRLATNHLLKGMDPHAVIIPNKLLQQLDDQSGGRRRVGIGVEIAIRRAQARIVRVHKGGPAAKAGLRPGDALLMLNGEPVAGWAVSKLDAALSGEAGSLVTLRLRRGRRFWRARLQRAAVRRSTVTGRRHGRRDEIAVVRLPVFASGAAADLQELLQQLRASNRRPLRAIVLDFRGNMGGWVNEAVAITRLFLRRGEIVRIKQRDEADEVHNADISNAKKKRAPKKHTVETVPLVILVDSACRSSCELVADALQAHGRALIVGATTYGKGTVQGVFEAERGKWSLLITIARYHGPDGGSVQARGVTPDVRLDGVKHGGFREKNYRGALATVRGNPKLRRGPTASRTRQLQRCLRRARTLAKRSTRGRWLGAIAKSDPAMAEAILLALRCVGRR